MADLAKDRKQVFAIMDQVMNQTYSSLYDSQELDTSLVKTYLVESHLDEDASQISIENYLESITQAPLSRNARFQVQSTNDSGLFALTANYKSELVVFYVDLSNPRFWLLHSANHSTSLDDLLLKLIKENEGLDRAWIWPELLNRIAQKGQFKGLSLDFDRRVLPDTDFQLDDSVEYLKLQLWGLQAPKVLQILGREFPNSSTLSKVKIKYWLSGQTNNLFSIDDIKSDGKITARGTSFQSHLALISSLYGDYQAAIKGIETKYALGWHEHEGGAAVLSGEPLNFVFDKPISNLDLFCRHLFNATLPFRLWGVPVRLSESFYRVSAVDLHAGCRLSLEVTPNFIRVYLPSGSCGNTVVRLYTNFKHHYDSKVRVEDSNDTAILEF